MMIVMIMMMMTIGATRGQIRPDLIYAFVFMLIPRDDLWRAREWVSAGGFPRLNGDELAELDDRSQMEMNVIIIGRCGTIALPFAGVA